MPRMTHDHLNTVGNGTAKLAKGMFFPCLGSDSPS